MTSQEDAILYKRLIELSNRAYSNNIYCFSDFLSIAQQDVFYRAAADPDFGRIRYTLFGGNDNCERKMVRFGSEEDFGYLQEFPIKCIKVAPASRKFSGEHSHRDYLGALMSLGLDRKKFGDIFVDGKDAYIYVEESACEYVMENLTSVGHDLVNCSFEEVPESYIKSALISKLIQVSSPRVDAVISRVYNLSRKDTLVYFTEKKVAVNGRIVENNDKMLAEGDTVSVRGFGKFNFAKDHGLSKKGKHNIEVEIFGR